MKGGIEEGESNERRTKTADEETVFNGRFFLLLSFHRLGQNSEEILVLLYPMGVRPPWSHPTF